MHAFSTKYLMRFSSKIILYMFRASCSVVWWYIGKDGHATVLTSSYIWRTIMMNNYGKTGCFGKDRQFWKRRRVTEKTDSYGKDGQLWKRRTVMEKTGNYGKDGQLGKRRTAMKKMGIGALLQGGGALGAVAKPARFLVMQLQILND